MKPRDIKEMRSQMRDQLPEVSGERLRRKHVPFPESFLYELKEDGFPETCEFLEKVLKLDEELYISEQDEITARTWLKDSRDIIEVLVQGLKKAEDAKISNKKNIMFNELLTTTLCLETRGYHWHWLVKTLFDECIKIASQMPTDRNCRMAVTKLFYGKFLLYKMNDSPGAFILLEAASEMAKDQLWRIRYPISLYGNYQVSPSKFPADITSLNAYAEICFLLHDAHAMIAKRKRSEDPTLALRHSHTAMTLANESNRHPEMEEAMIELGITYQYAENYEKATSTLISALAMCRKYRHPIGACNVAILLAHSYEKTGQLDKTQYHLQEAINVAQRNGYDLMLAKAHKKLGEFFFNQDQSVPATNNFNASYEIYASHKMTEEMDSIAALCAFSKAETVFPKLAKKLLRIGESQLKPLMQVLDWKLNLTPFWVPDAGFETNYTTFHSLSEDESMSEIDESSYIQKPFSSQLQTDSETISQTSSVYN